MKIGAVTSALIPSLFPMSLIGITRIALGHHLFDDAIDNRYRILLIFNFPRGI
jgi:hypothetical protein